MAFNGSGTFTRIYNWVVDKANGINITASRMDTEFDGIATGLSTCITKDGQTTLTANIPFANYKITGLGNGTARSDAINVGQVQDNQFLYLGTTTGSADAYTLSPAPTITAYATTQQFVAKIHATNTTTTPYLQISGIANPSTTAVIKKLNASRAEIAVEASDLLANGIYTFQRNSANDAWIILNPEKSYYNLINATKATTTTQGISYLNNPITIAFNSTTAMDFGAGNVNYDNGSGQLLCSAITNKILQSSGIWSAGSSGNGLDTSSRANSTWYNIFEIVNNSNGANDILYSTNRTAPTVPSGYTLVAWIGKVRTDGSGNIDQNYLAEKTSFGQFVYQKLITVATGTTTIPADDTIPQNTEGNQILSLPIEPIKSGSNIEIDCYVALVGHSSGNTQMTIALFQDSTANALASSMNSVSVSTRSFPLNLKHMLKSTLTSTTTFNIRIGGNDAGTTTINGTGGSRLLGGSGTTILTIKEYL